MIIKRLEQLPERFSGVYSYTSEPLSSYDVDKLESFGFQEVRYYYGVGYYEGGGFALLNHNGRWFKHDMGHCSCYGPTDHLELSGNGFATLDEMKASCTPEALSEIAPLLDL